MLDSILPAASAQAASGAGTGSSLLTFAPLVLIIVVFWFLLIRPQKKRFEARQKMLAAIEKGDQIITEGGLKGKVTKVVDAETLEVEFSSSFRAMVHRPLINTVTVKRNAAGAQASAPASKSAASKPSGSLKRSPAKKKAKKATKK